jgi:hypothetical protein
MYTVNTETNPVGKNSVGCLSKGCLEYQKALDNVWEGVFIQFVGAFPLVEVSVSVTHCVSPRMF